MISCPFPDYLLFPVRYPPCRPSPCVVFFKLSNDCNPPPKTTEEKRQRSHNAIKQFLLKKCGFSLSEIPAVISKDPSICRFKSTLKAQQALELFIDSGFTPQQVRKTILRVPGVLKYKDGALKEKIEFFKTLGLEQDLGKVISRAPRILTSKLDENLSPKVSLLEDLFGSSDDVSRAIRRVPQMLCCGVDAMKEKIRIMERNGVKAHEIKEILDKDPRFLASSIDKLEKNMVFLTDVVGFRPSILVKYPKFLNYSVEKRLMPRHKVFKYLTEVLKAEDVGMSLPSMFGLTEQGFEVKILMSRPQLAMLYDDYRSKSVDLDRT